MQSTCFKECFLWKKYGDRCPNYVIGYWRPEGSSSDARIEDCVPRRTLDELKVIHSLLIGLHKTSNEEREAANRVNEIMIQVVEKATQGRILLYGSSVPETALPAPEAGRGVK